MTDILIRYAEIGLKGKNRAVFEDQLVKNIRLALGANLIQIIKEHKQFIVKAKEPVLNQLKRVFGIAWFAPVAIVANNQKSITQAALKLVEPKKTFAVRAHHDLEVSLGEIIRTKKKIQVDGFDSVAAAYRLAKRGAQVDFLHFHVFTDERPVLKSKIKTIVDGLQPWTLSQKLYLASYLPFQMAVLSLSSRDTKQELVVYRRLMVRVGEELAKKFGYQALILGDSLGQVASQTLENIVAVDRAVAIPVFRPLIGNDKNETINLVHQIGLEAAVNQPYKDCCSLISTHPATRADLTKIAKIESRIKIDTIIKEIVDHVQIINL
ncbi:MAG: putative tRNA sulfurtransferase [Parcubacteria group bacterium GW2011_GWA2_36_24]|nr:MAG: putative tRNA sulfurtransferase [Parcubacteria group bacterium GW2011_GWA2_36_24]